MSIKAKGFHDNNPEQGIDQNSVFLFLKPGVTQLRVLPAYSEEGKWFKEIKEIPRHVNGKYSPLISPSTIGDFCPFEAEGRRLYALKGEKNVELAREFRPRRSYLFNVVVQEQPDFEGDVNHCVKVLKCGVKVKDQILDLDQDHAGGWGDVTNLEKGFDLRITRSGKGRTDTTYTVKGVPGRTNILDWLEENGYTQELTPHNLDDLFNPSPIDEVNKHLHNFKLQLGLIEEDAAVDDIPMVTDGEEQTEAPDLGE